MVLALAGRYAQDMGEMGRDAGDMGVEERVLALARGALRAGASVQAKIRGQGQGKGQGPGQGPGVGLGFKDGAEDLPVAALREGLT